MKLMITPFAKGGIRSVVEAYMRDGLISSEEFEIIKTYDDGPFWKRQTMFVSALAQLVSKVLKQKIDLVHIHVAMKGSFWRKSLFVLIAKSAKVPILLHMHGSEMKKFYYSQPNFLKKVITKVLSSSDKVVVLSRSWQEFVVSIAPKAKVAVLENYVSLPSLGSREESEAPTIVFLGLVGKRKGTFDLISAFAQVLKTHPDAKLLIGGNGMLDEAKSQIDQLSLGSSIQLLGWVGEQERHRLLNSAWAYVLPSYNEGLPMSVLEAMSYGLPVVTSNVGGIPELIDDDVNGIMITPGETGQLAAALTSLLTDENARRGMGGEARKTIEMKYSEDIALMKLRKYYKDILSV